MPLKMVSDCRPPIAEVVVTGSRLAGRYSAVPASRKAQLRATESGRRGWTTASQRGQRARRCARAAAGGAQTAPQPRQRQSPAASAEQAGGASVAGSQAGCIVAPSLARPQSKNGARYANRPRGGGRSNRPRRPAYWLLRDFSSKVLTYSACWRS